MKKAFISIIICISLCLLGGCKSAGSIYSNYREISQLALIETAGIDKTAGGVALTVSSAASSGDTPSMLMTQRGASVALAMQSLQSYASNRELFYAHLKHIVFGCDTAKGGIAEFLDYVERSVGIRMGVSLFVVKDRNAKDLLLGPEDTSYAISEVLQAVERDVTLRGSSHIFTCGETARALSERGAALICCLQMVSTDDIVKSVEAGSIAVPCGFGILRDGALVGYLDREESAAACMLMGLSGETEYKLSDTLGGEATVSLDKADVAIEPVWGEGGLERVDIKVKASAALVEMSRPEHYTDDAYLQLLGEELRRRLISSFASVLEAENELGRDFLGLGGSLRGGNSGKFDAMEPGWPDCLGETNFRVAVEADVGRTYDLNESTSYDGGGALNEAVQ